MAEIVPNEGLDVILGQFPGAATRLSTTYVGLFTNFTAATVMGQTQTMANVTEAAFTGYARQALAAATWGAPAAGAVGRKVTYPQITFPTAGSGPTTVNGFFVADALTAGKVIYMANFDDVTARTLASGDIIRVTPALEFQP